MSLLHIPSLDVMSHRSAPIVPHPTLEQVQFNGSMRGYQGSRPCHFTVLCSLLFDSDQALNIEVQYYPLSVFALLVLH